MKLIAVAVSALAALGSLGGTLRIMPLGDSITYGQGWDPHGGYRAVLREKLVEAGYDVDYVGTQTGNQGTLAAAGDVEHEGHPGWTVDRVTAALPEWSSRIDGPHIVLLKIGTNNCNGDHATVISQIGDLLDAIKRLQPSAHVIVGTLIPFLNGSEVGSNNAWIQAHNELLRAEVQRRANLGDGVSLADLYSVVSPTEGMNDDRHPNESGYRAMAQVWFDAIRTVCPNPDTAGGDVDLTAVSCVMDEAKGDRVTVSFNGTVGDGAADLSHYDFGPAFSPDHATLASDRRSVTVFSSRPMQAGVECALAVSGVRNCADTRSVVPMSATFRFLPYGARYYVPEAGLYRKVYGFTFPNAAGYQNTPPVYDFDDHLNVGSYTRIAYYVELQKNGEEMQYLWVSMDSFTDDAGRIAIPTRHALTGEKEIIQQFVYNMKVWSNVDGVVSGEKARGNLEFWPYNYYKDTKLGIEGASSGIYDVDDSCNLSGSFACMQIHDTDALTPLFCFNNWGGTGGGYDLGLGRQPGTGNTDWTQSNTGGTWNKHRIMEIYVLEDVSDSTVPAVTSTALSESRTKVTVSFDRPIANEPDMMSKVSFADGHGIRSVTFADARTLVVTCAYLDKVTTASLVIDGLHAANPAHTPIPRQELSIPGEDVAVSYAIAPDNVLEKVPEAANFAHLFTIDIQPNLNLNIKDGTDYVNKVDPDVYAACHVVDNSNSVPALYSRVGYLLELVDNNDRTNWVWTAFDAFSSDYGDIDIPTANPDHPKGGYVNGRFVSNLDVDSNVDGVAKGKGLQTGVIEFSPWDYGGANARGVPNATDSYDFGDNLYVKVGNYACMQVHNYAASQVVWAVGRFNGRGVCVGIGNSTDGNNIDYTFVNNAGNYKSRTLYVLVKPDYEADESTDYAPRRAVASVDGRKVCVSFDAAVLDSAAQARYYAIPGRTVVAAEHSAADARDVILTLAEPLVSGETYSVETCLPKSTNKTLQLLTSRPLPEALWNGVEEIGDYTLLYDLTVPQNSYIAANGADYRTDESRFGLGRKIERIAYALELQYNEANGGESSWAWVSMDPFTEDPAMMGVPSVTRGNHFQCYVDNISVRAGSSSGSSPIATGEWSQGNIEFTPSNYSSENERNIPGATGAFDFGDRLYGNGSSAGHGCMQIHNYLEGDMILGFSRLGGGQVPGLLIGLLRNQDGSVSDDGTWTANVNKMTTHELRVFVKLAAEEPVVGDRGIGPVFLVQPESRSVKIVAGAGPQKVSLNAYAPNTTRYQWRKNGVDIAGATGPVLDVVVAGVGCDTYDVVAFIDDSNYTFSSQAAVEGLPAGFHLFLR